MVSDNSSTRACCAGVKKWTEDLLSATLEVVAGAALASVCSVSSDTVGTGNNEPPRMLAEVFSHWRRSCLRSMGLFLDMIFSLEISFPQFVPYLITGTPP